MVENIRQYQSPSNRVFVPNPYPYCMATKKQQLNMYQSPSNRVFVPNKTKPASASTWKRQSINPLVIGSSFQTRRRLVGVQRSPRLGINPLVIGSSFQTDANRGLPVDLMVEVSIP